MSAPPPYPAYPGGAPSYPGASGAAPAYGGAPPSYGGAAPSYPGAPSYGGAPSYPGAGAPAYPGGGGRSAPPSYGGGSVGGGGGAGGAGAAGSGPAAPPSYAVAALDTSTEMRLFVGAMERQKIDDLADLYAAIVATEHLEASFVRGNVSREDYERECALLITRFKTMSRTLVEAGHISSAAAFMSEYGLNARCGKAKNTLVVVGMPTTMVHMQHDGRDSARHVRDCTQYFITAMDNLRLNVVDVDEVLPNIRDVVMSMNRLVGLPPDFGAKAKMQRWVETLNAMRAADRLNDDQARQLIMDLETSYADFNHWLDTAGGGK
mmetsp:Transcript_14195/g.49365  ORF Transcript_14195/g.49365 Transcript_14195/m.49365 type:complete len:321 (-) Transcript_14195:120-1082(-)